LKSLPSRDTCFPIILNTLSSLVITLPSLTMAASFENLPNDASDDQVTKINGQVIVDEASGLPSNSQKVTSNGVAASDPASSGANPLDIVICGAGIGGLSAAIGLRSQGHRVVVSQIKMN
jgi:hypothetical protein